MLKSLLSFGVGPLRPEPLEGTNAVLAVRSGLQHGDTRELRSRQDRHQLASRQPVAESCRQGHPRAKLVKQLYPTPRSSWLTKCYRISEAPSFIQFAFS